MIWICGNGIIKAIKVLVILREEGRRLNMKLSEIKELKREYGFTNEDLARMSTVPLSTVQKIMSGEVKSPRYDTLEKLSGALMAVGTQASQYDSRTGSSEVHEDNLAYCDDDSFAQRRRKTIINEMETKKRGEFTLEDFYALPDEHRVELIDGVLYDMAAPRIIHQQAAMAIYNQLRAAREKCNKNCNIFGLPIDVQLDKDDRTMIEPDLVVLCDKSKIIGRCIYGAPDLVVEILSKSTKRKDMSVKLNKYLEAGVKEYWIVDILKKDDLRVLVYDFAHDDWWHMYTFDDKVPVGISEGKCFVDFSKVKEELDFDLPEEPPVERS